MQDRTLPSKLKPRNLCFMAFPRFLAVFQFHDIHISEIFSVAEVKILVSPSLEFQMIFLVLLPPSTFLHDYYTFQKELKAVLTKRRLGGRNLINR